MVELAIVKAMYWGENRKKRGSKKCVKRNKFLKHSIFLCLCLYLCSDRIMYIEIQYSATYAVHHILYNMQALLTKPENKLFSIARMHTNQFNCSEDWKKSPDLAFIYYSKHGKVYCGRC